MQEFLSKAAEWWKPLPREKKWKYAALGLAGLLLLLFIF